MRLVAVATDGVPEAIEVEDERFCMGVQWHPEYTWESIPTDFQLWCAFVQDERFCMGVQWHPEYTWESIPTDFQLWCAFVQAARGER